MKLQEASEISLLAGCILKTTDPQEPEIRIRKRDDEQQLVFGEVYAPGFPDSQRGLYDPAHVQKMAYNLKGLMSNIDVNHSQTPSGSYIVESFIARKNDDIYLPESWVIWGSRPRSDDLGAGEVRRVARLQS